MALIDINSPVGMLRLRVGDTRDIPVLPDEVYEQALEQNNGNLKAAAILCGQYILASLAFDGQQQMGIIQIWGQQVFKQYKEYLTMVVKDPAFSSVSPIPYSGSNGTCPVIEFKKDWDRAYQDCCHKTWEKL